MALSVKNMLGGSGGGASPFAWGKYESLTIPPVDAVNPTFNFSSSGNTITISNSSTDLTLIGDNWKDYFDGFVPNSGTYPYFRKDRTILYVYLNSYTTLNIQTIAVTNATSCKLTFNDTYSQSSMVMKYEGTKHIKDGEDTIGNFLEYLTDKNPLKYPNGEVLTDGFFYRYANEGLYTWDKSRIEKILNPSYFSEITKVPNDSNYVTTCVHDDKLYAFSDKSYYTWADGTWNYEGTLPQVMSCSASYGGKLYAFYGNSSSNLGKYYVLEDGTWVENNMPIVESGNYLDPYYCSNPVEYNGELWIHGACPNLGGTFLYSFDGTTWTRHGDINSAYPSPKYMRNCMAVWNGELYCYVANRGLTKYNSANDTWTTLYSWTATFGYCLYVGADNNLYLVRTDASTWTSYIFDGSSFAQDSTFTATSTGNNWSGVAKYEESMYFVFYAHTYIRGRYEYKNVPFDIVISDNENAYPDGGEQDGYYYEASAKGIAPEMFGCTKYEVYEFAKSSNTLGSNYAIPHTLGERPKFVSIYAENVPSSPVTGFIYCVASYNIGKASGVKALCGFNSYGTLSYNGNETMNYYDNQVIFSASGLYYQAGVNYKVVIAV